MTEATHLSKAAADRLGERLCAQITEEDLKILDAYRRTFHTDYELVVEKLRNVIGIEVTGRPAKSTPAIIEKLKRSSMRLSQMQDIAGCRTVVADTVAQDELVARIQELFPATVYDRRDKPSHGYRAVHVVAKPGRLPIEIQVRTELQHLWAELSEKCADALGIDVKHGGGNNVIRTLLDMSSTTVRRYDECARSVFNFGTKLDELQNSATIPTDPDFLNKLNTLKDVYNKGCVELKNSRQEILDVFDATISFFKATK